jgi:hypothetical protein
VRDILLSLGRPVSAILGCLVNVPELDPPIEQERVLCHLILGELWGGHLAWWLGLCHVGAIGLVSRAVSLRWPSGHLETALDHGARGVVVVVAQEIVVDVRVELFARVGARTLGVWHAAHDGGAVHGSPIRTHGRHLRRHIGILHRDAGRMWSAASGAVDRQWKGDRRAVVVIYAMARRTSVLQST